MFTCLQCKARLTTCNQLLRSRMRSYHHNSCSWSSSSDQVGQLPALTWKLLQEHLCSLATPGEHRAMWCRYPWSVARVYDRPWHQLWNYKIYQHTYRSDSLDDTIWCTWSQGFLPQGSNMDAGHSLGAFDSLHWIWTAYTNFHMLCYSNMIVIVCQKRNNEFQMLCVGFKVVKIIMLCFVDPWWLNRTGFNLIDLCSNLVPVWVCNIHRGPLLQITSCKLSFVHTSNAMDQMLFCCTVLFQYFTNICQCGASANAFATRHVA